MYTIEIILTVITIGGGLNIEVIENEKSEKSLMVMSKKLTVDPVLGLGVITVVITVASLPLPRAKVVVTGGNEKTVSPSYVLGGNTYRVRES